MARPRTLSTGRKPTTGNAIKGWLDGYLSDGPRAVKDIRRVATDRGYAWRTVERCAAELGIESNVYWSAPSPASRPPETASVPEYVPVALDDGWSDADCEKASYDELLEERRAVFADLGEAQRWHGTKRHGAVAGHLETIDLSERIEHLQKQIERIDRWAEKKF